MHLKVLGELPPVRDSLNAIEKEPERKQSSLRKPPPPAGQLNAPKINEKPEEPQASKIEPRASKTIAMDWGSSK